MMDKRFIEESFPVKEVSEESANEKKIFRGNIPTFHVWWARRPLASSRATAYAALIPSAKDKDDYKKKRKFIVDLSKWDNILNQKLIESANKDIIESSNGKIPKVLDPFSGGGAIPLEALRLGCETYANDYNPVAVLIEKCILEYPQKYGKKISVDIKKYGDWVLEESRKELAKYYAKINVNKKNFFGDSEEASIPVGYIWARTVKCQNPNCEAEIPLLKQLWLANKPGRKIALYPEIENNQIKFKIVGTGYEKIPNRFDPSIGLVKRAKAECKVCGTVIDAESVRRQFIDGKSFHKLIVVVYSKPGNMGKKYQIPSPSELRVIQESEEYLVKKVHSLEEKWGIEPVPKEPLKRVPVSFGVINVWFYGMNTWGSLFNGRQKLAIITFIDNIRKVYSKMIEDNHSEEYAKVICTYLGTILSKSTNFNSSLSMWASNRECSIGAFSRNALQMVWDYFEINPFSGLMGSWKSLSNWSLKSLNTCFSIKKIKEVGNASATNLPYDDNFFDAVFTDPPYYDNIPYSYLSDFFYVWLNRSIGHLYPDLFITPLTPKSEEVVAYNQEGSKVTSKEYFESMFRKSLKEIFRVLKNDGIAVIVYAHKTTEGWETVINSLLDSGLTVTASWPLSTERQIRMRSNESAALGSSIYIVARKIKKKELGLYPKVKKELHNYLNEKLERLWQEGISGADFFIAAIGAGIEIFGEYEKIIDDEGKVVRADKLLEEIRTISTNFAVKQILHNGFAGEISPLTRFYVLWRWNYQEAKVPFDEARKLSQSFSVNLEKEWNKGFIIKEKEFIKVIGPKERQLKDLEDSKELIDVLHYVLLLWEKGEKDKLLKKLSEGYGNSEAFYRVAQAVSQTLPNESKEKKLIDGFLAGKEKIKEEVKSSARQDKLGRWVK